MSIKILVKDVKVEMSEHLHTFVLFALKAMVKYIRVISINTHEVTMINNTSWVGVHIYVIDL